MQINATTSPMSSKIFLLDKCFFIFVDVKKMKSQVERKIIRLEKIINSRFLLDKEIK